MNMDLLSILTTVLLISFYIAMMERMKSRENIWCVSVIILRMLWGHKCVNTIASQKLSPHIINVNSSYGRFRLC